MIIRLWIDQDRFDESIRLNDKEQHYLYTVMRRQSLDQILVFNEKNGEWSAQLRGAHLNILQPKRKFIRSKSINLAIGCIKKHRIELLIEKATELGVHNIYLLDTQYSQRIHYDFPRLQSIAIEAAEQSNRLSIPKIHKPIALENLLKLDMKFILTEQSSESISDYSLYNCAIVGPEGGWSDAELEQMQDLAKMKLSDTILRSETAGIIAISKFI